MSQILINTIINKTINIKILILRFRLFYLPVIILFYIFIIHILNITIMPNCIFYDFTYMLYEK